MKPQALFARLALTLILTSSVRSEQESERVKVIRPEVSAQVIKAQLGPDGSINLLLQGKDGPQYSKSTDNGATFSAPILIVDEKARNPGLEFHGEDIAVGKDGRVFVAMSNNAWKLKLPESEWGLYFASLSPSERAFTPTRNLNLKPSEGFSLATDGNGNVAASFLSDKLYMKISNDNGATFSPNTEPNPDWNPCNCCTTSSTFGADGKLAILYREETDNERDMYLILLNRDDPQKPVRKRVSSTPWKLEGCPMTYFSVTATASGYIAAWPTKGEIYFAMLDKDGKALPPGEIKTPGSNGMRTGVLALGAKGGSSLVAWKKNESLGWQLYDAEGKPVGSTGSSASSGSGAAGVALSDGTFLLFR